MYWLGICKDQKPLPGKKESKAGIRWDEQGPKIGLIWLATGFPPSMRLNDMRATSRGDLPLALQILGKETALSLNYCLTDLLLD